MSDSAKVAHYKTAFGKAKTNLSPELLDKLAHINAWHAREDTFGDGVMSKLTITEFGTFVRPEDGKTHGRIVYEGIVTQDMCNSHGMMHGGCAAFMVDCCTSIALVIMGLATGGPVDLVSQSLTTTYHAGAKLGDKIRVVNTSTAGGKRAVTARAEIWDLTTKRLTVIGNHVKMVPSKSEFKL
ncbi:HotDog domain-containing protein [Fomitopsis betulina]|nr:HotDog domain-containing protein [Fomitopsis betulina]